MENKFLINKTPTKREKIDMLPISINPIIIYIMFCRKPFTILSVMCSWFGVEFTKICFSQNYYHLKCYKITTRIGILQLLLLFFFFWGLGLGEGWGHVCTGEGVMGSEMSSV